MIKATLEPNRLRAMLAQAMKLKGGSGPVDSVLLNFTKDGVKTQTALQADIMVFAEYNRGFFKELEVTEEVEQFMANTGLVKKRLAFGFKGESITMKTDAEKVTFTGQENDDVVTQRLDTIDETRVAPFGVEKTSIGLVPSQDGKVMPFAFSILVAVDNFKDSLPYEHAVLTTTNDGKVSLSFKDETGSRERTVVYKNPTARIQETEIIFNYKTFQELIAMFSGEVWLSGDSTKIVISQTSNEFSLTYAHATMKEEV